jgi:hypothetical protein
MSTGSPPSPARPGHPVAATPAMGATPPRSAGAQSASSAAARAQSAGKSAAHKSPSGHGEPSATVTPSQPAKSAPAVAPTQAPKVLAATHHLTSKDGALERLMQAKARLRGAATKAESSAPSHSPMDGPAKGGGSSAQLASPSHAVSAGSPQNAHVQAPVPEQIGEHKARQGLTHPTSSVPQSGDATFIQRMLAHGLAHQATAASGHTKTQHPLASSGVAGLKR